MDHPWSGHSSWMLLEDGACACSPQNTTTRLDLRLESASRIGPEAKIRLRIT